MPAAPGMSRQLLSGKVCQGSWRKKGPELPGSEAQAGGRVVGCVQLWCLCPGDGVPVTVPVPNRLAVHVTLAGQQASTRTASTRWSSCGGGCVRGLRRKEGVQAVRRGQRLVQQAFSATCSACSAAALHEDQDQRQGVGSSLCTRPRLHSGWVHVRGTGVGPSRLPQPSRDLQKDLETRESPGGSVATETSIHQKAEVIFQECLSSSGMPCSVAKGKAVVQGEGAGDLQGQLRVFPVHPAF